LRISIVSADSLCQSFGDRRSLSRAKSKCCSVSFADRIDTSRNLANSFGEAAAPFDDRGGDPLRRARQLRFQMGSDAFDRSRRPVGPSACRARFVFSIPGQ
jgi:hypothetical protein